jgi:hypothetical protein
MRKEMLSQNERKTSMQQLIASHLPSHIVQVHKIRIFGEIKLRETRNIDSIACKGK